jgi:hypothetical protein
MKRLILIACAAVLIASTGAAAYADDSTPKAKQVALPLALNILPGLGAGSFVQGDVAGGLVGLGGEALGVGCFGAGLVYGIGGAVGGAFAKLFTFGLADAELSEADSARVAALVLGGLAIWAGTKVFEIVRPIVYARRYNAEHGFAEAVLAPSLALSAKDGFEPGLVLTLAY